MRKYLNTVLLSAIILLAIILRFYQLGSVPPSPNWDEAALGYNAYSIWETGKDEYGKFMPVVLRSFDDYKPALYAYLIIPSYLIFGLDVFAVRFPSAFFGTLTVLAVYFLVLEIFGRGKISLLGKDIDTKIISLGTAFLLAISPWHIQFSRVAFESNVGLAFNVFGALFFLKGINKRHWYLVLSAFFFALSPSVYQSDKVFTPLLFLTLVCIFWRKIILIPKKILLASFIVGIVVLLPIASFHLTDSQALARASGVSVFSDQNMIKESAEKLQVDRASNDIFGLIVDNRRVEFIKATLAGYLSHFDLNWLFINGDIARHHAPNMGLLYIFELPFLLIGIYQLLFLKNARKAKYIVFAWFLLAPVPAMITSGVPHAVRTLNFLPTFQIFVALGFTTAFVFLDNFRRSSILRALIRYAVLFVFALVFLSNFVFFLNQYFVQQNVENSREWLYGYKEAVEKASGLEGDYEKIIVSNQPPLDQSYIFFLFYLKYPPSEYQKISQYSSGGFRENHKFGKYEFNPLQDLETRERVLYVGRPSDFPAKVKTFEQVYYLDGKPAIYIVPSNYKNYEDPKEN